MRRFVPVLLVLAVLLPGCGIPWGHLNPLYDAYRTGVWYARETPRLTADIPYGPAKDQRLDVYRTDAKGPAPVVFLIHGGAWQYGDQKQLASMAKVLGDLGYVAVLPDYRKYPEVRYPAFVDDIVAALDWTEAHVAEYGGDPTCLVVAGHSAGAHLAIAPFADDAFRKKLTFDVAHVKGIAPISGPFDFAALAKSAATQEKLRKIMGGQEGYDAAEPIHHLRADLPPVLILVGSKDKITPPGQVEAYAKSLKAAGADVRFEKIPGVDHITILLSLAKVEEGRAGESFYGFVREVTKGCGAVSGPTAEGR